MKKILLSTVCALLFFLPVSFAAKSSANTAVSEATSQPTAGSIDETMKEFKNLSKQERKERLKEVKKAVKQFKADKKAGAEASTNTLLLVIVAKKSRFGHAGADITKENTTIDPCRFINYPDQEKYSCR